MIPDVAALSNNSMICPETEIVVGTAAGAAADVVLMGCEEPCEGRLEDAPEEGGNDSVDCASDGAEDGCCELNCPPFALAAVTMEEVEMAVVIAAVVAALAVLAVEAPDVVTPAVVVPAVVLTVDGHKLAGNTQLGKLVLGAGHEQVPLIRGEKPLAKPLKFACDTQLMLSKDVCTVNVVTASLSLW